MAARHSICIGLFLVCFLLLIAGCQPMEEEEEITGPIIVPPEFPRDCLENVKFKGQPVCSPAECQLNAGNPPVCPNDAECLIEPLTATFTWECAGKGGSLYTQATKPGGCPLGFTKTPEGLCICESPNIVQEEVCCTVQGDAIDCPQPGPVEKT